MKCNGRQHQNESKKNYWNDIFNNFNDKWVNIKCCVLCVVCIFSIVACKWNEKKQWHFQLWRILNSRYIEWHRSTTCATILNHRIATFIHSTGHQPSTGFITNDGRVNFKSSKSIVFVFTCPSYKFQNIQLFQVPKMCRFKLQPQFAFPIRSHNMLCDSLPMLSLFEN